MQREAVQGRGPRHHPSYDDAHGAGLDGRRARHCFWQTVAVLAAFNVGRAFGLWGPPGLAVVLLLAALVLVARLHGVTGRELGLSRAGLRRGALYGAAAALVVLLVLLAAAVLPATNGFLHDSRAEIPGGRLGYELAVPVLLLTAIPEELAFRGLLLGSALRVWRPWRAALLSSALFGLWHVAPTLHTMSGNSATDTASSTGGGAALVVAGAVMATFVGGLVFSWLRLRSRSLLAPVIAHVATNGLALTVAWFAVH